MRKNPTTLDLSYAVAATVLARQPERGPITFWLVGCGGNGSHVAQHLGRLLFSMKARGIRARAIFVDHDTVEPKNVGRQNFSSPEVGRNKAETLARRFGAAWGLDIEAVPSRFKHTMFTLDADQDELGVIVGCVDNAAGRVEMNKCLSRNGQGRVPDVWHLDCGNHEQAGQVLLGSAWHADQLKGAFPSRSLCHALPGPALQSPELLVARPEERAAAKKMSCAELVAANQQSHDINAAVAVAAKTMLTQLFLTRDLKRLACEVNNLAGSMRSTYVTPEAVARITSKPVKFIYREAA
jgi:PRTRC genetic system ThiF family protein